jgi:hypothetical protein
LHDNLGFNFIIYVNIVMAREMGRGGRCGRGARGRGRGEGELLPPHEILYAGSLLTG